MSPRWLLMVPVAGAAMLLSTNMPSAQSTKQGGNSSNISKDNSDIELVEKLLIARRDYVRASSS